MRAGYECVNKTNPHGDEIRNLMGAFDMVGLLRLADEPEWQARLN